MEERRCTYCNQCRPCPAGLNIGLINQYYDQAQAGEQDARVKYLALPRKASDCIRCGHCNRKCPHHVSQRYRMKKIAEYFRV